MKYKKIIGGLILGVGFIPAFAQDINLKIHLRGVYDSKISLQSLTGATIKTVVEKVGVKKGDITSLKVSKDMLPGEFVLRFDYREKESSAPYPAERRIIINKQHLELRVNPLFINNPDSTYFGESEIENALLARFQKESAAKKEKLMLLQNLLLGYDQPHTVFYKSAVVEYDSRRKEYNQWLSNQQQQHAGKFVSHMFTFQSVPQLDWIGSEGNRVESLIANYFDGINFQDTVLIKTNDFKDWMNGYVNIYGTQATSEVLRDSLFVLAGRRAIEKAREGHPLVYGWMVDYFYNGFESFNMQKGIQMLEAYLGDPRCLTTKRIAIEKRLKGIETLIPGALAPDFMIKDDAGKTVEFSKYSTGAKHKLLLFWSADCQHCKDLVKDLKPWFKNEGGKSASVFAVSLDDTDSEISAWKIAVKDLPDWKHYRAQGGINSPEANAYYVLSTPFMILIDTKTNRITALPNTVDELRNELK